MDELKELFQQILNQDLIQITLSNTVDRERAVKVKVRPVMTGGKLVFQETLFRGTQVFHSNHAKEEMLDRLVEYMTGCFRQAQLSSVAEEATVLVSRKRKVTVKRRRHPNVGGNEERLPDLSHNRFKRYVLPEGLPVDFLIELGVQTPDGRIINAKYDKFRQINRYLEFIRDILNIFPSDRTIRIVDFGCGKSYLTFAMYYYLHQVEQRDIKVMGLDLKADVIRHCSALAEKLHYEGLSFQEGDIQSFRGEEQVDMVVSLHACDKATDYALEKAVKWGASVIMAVPCCQHELNRQIHCETLQPLLKYGVIKERMAALITDALRANLLEQKGYDTQILEFIDMGHTPKNLMIRAVKSNAIRPAGRTGVQEDSTCRLMDFLQVNPTLKELL